KAGQEWLRIKEEDAYVSADSALPPESVLYGLTVEELQAGKEREAAERKALASHKANRGAVTGEEAEPMLAAPREPGVWRAGGRSRGWPGCLCSVCWRSMATTCGRCRSSSARPCSSRSCREWARSSISRTSRRTAKRCMSKW